MVNKAEILRLTDIKMSVVTASGREGSKVLSNPESPPADGLFYEGLHRVREIGQYQIDIIAEGRTFQRKRSISMTVMEPVEVIQQPDIENNLYRIVVKPLANDIDLERTRVIAKIKSPDDSTMIQSVLYNSEVQAWVSEIAPDKGTGEYSVELNVRGITSNDRSFKVTPAPIIFDLPIKAVDNTAPNKSEVLVEPVAPKEQEISNEPVDVEPGIAVDIEANLVAAIEDDKVVADKPVEDTAEEVASKDEGLAWWVYLIIALASASVIGAAVWWFLLRKPAAVDAQTERDKKEMLADLEDPEDEFSGDFDSLDEGEEEDIPLVTEPASILPEANDSDSSAEVEVETSLENDSIEEVVEETAAESVEEPPVLEDTVMDDLPSEEVQAEEAPVDSIDDEGFPTEDDFDENFSIDPDDELDFDEDSWGEFDEDKDDKKD